MANNSLVNIPVDVTNPLELKQCLMRVTEELNKAVGTNGEAVSIRSLNKKVALLASKVESIEERLANAGL